MEVVYEVAERWPKQEALQITVPSMTVDIPTLHATPSSIPTVESEERVPFLPLLATLAFLGVIAMVVSDLQTETWLRWELLAGGLLLQVCAGVAWWLAGRRPQHGRWLAIGAATCVVLLGDWSQFGATVLLLLPLPALLALALQGVGAAMLIAGLETAALFALPATLERMIALVALWLILTIVYLTLRPLHEVTAWSWQQYAHARELLDAARNHKADLEQALQELVGANRQLDLLNERLAAMRLLAEDASKTKAAFVAKVSHELRTPLNMIIGLIDLTVQTPDLYGDALPAALLEDLHIVQRNCTHLASMIDDVLDLSQTEAGRLVLHREWVDLRPDIETALAVVRPLLEKKKLAFALYMAADLPKIYCDRTRIRQVILNLLSNAARYTEQGSVNVTVTLAEQSLLVQVTDTGAGIASKDLERIFAPFYQAGDGLWQERKGSGLGLSISKQFIELHQGTIWVESVVGVGSTFAFRLPIAPAIPLAAGAGRWISEDWLWHERLAPPRLLSSPYTQRLVLYDESGELAALLDQADATLEIIDAPDFAAALQAAQTCPAHALMLNTADLPALWPLIARAQQAVPDTPILGYTLPPRPHPGATLGILDYLTKPITRADLNQALSRRGRPVQRILVVDDDPAFRSLLTRMLHALDPLLTVTAAANGREALDLLQAEPDLLFLDVTMPELDGWEVLRLKNADARTQPIPVIILSAQDPSREALRSDCFVTGLGRGLSGHQLLHCSLSLASLLLQPACKLDRAPQ